MVPVPSEPVEPFELLALGLRSRAATVAELAALARREEAELRPALASLEERGYLSVEGAQIRYAAPLGAAADDVRRRAEQLLERVGGMAAELTGVLHELPMLQRSWSIGEVKEPLQLDLELFHGESAVTDLWHRLLGRFPLSRTDIVLPDASPLAVADPDMQRTWHEVIGRPGNRARVIGSLADGTSPAMQDRLGQELAAGLEVRLMHRPPSWFWVADGRVVAFPLQWGETWPTTVAALESPAAAGLASWAFDRLWEDAVPPRDDSHPWDALLRLMHNGATLEAASRVLGISERTGRRRLGDAMEHYRAANLIALGAAWGRAKGRG